MSKPTPYGRIDDDHGRPEYAGQRAHGHDGSLDHGLTTEARIVLRPVASPLPLAFAAFGIGSCVSGLQQLGAFSVTDMPKINLMLLVFLAPLQLIAALISFWAREALVATGLSLLAFSWPAVLLVSQGAPPGSTSPVLGAFYLVLGGFLAVLSLPGFASKPLLSSLIVVAAARFVVSGLYELLESTPLERAAGILGLVITGIGLYGALALGLEDAMHRTVLPLGRRGEAKLALEGDLGAQTQSLVHEAGVRRQL